MNGIVYDNFNCFVCLTDCLNFNYAVDHEIWKLTYMHVKIIERGV